MATACRARRGQGVLTNAVPCWEVKLVAERPRFKTPLDRLQSIGDHIKHQRLNRNLLQRDVAEQLGVSKFTVLRWENNQGEPLVHHFPGIYAFLGYDPAAQPRTVGQRILSARRRRGLTQFELARRLAVDPSTVHGWEHDEHRPIGQGSVRLEEFLEEVESQGWERWR